MLCFDRGPKQRATNTPRRVGPFSLLAAAVLSSSIRRAPGGLEETGSGGWGRGGVGR